MTYEWLRMRLTNLPAHLWPDDWLRVRRAGCGLKEKPAPLDPFGSLHPAPHNEKKCKRCETMVPVLLSRGDRIRE